MTNKNTVWRYALIGTICLLGTLPLLAVCPLTDPADCIYVDGDDGACLSLGSGGTGSQTVPFCTIQDGYDHAVALGTSPTDIKTVLVLPATYNECVVAAADNPPCDCCTKDSMGGTGCDCATCETDVCAIEPFCCEVVWDGFCDFVATDLCSCCDGLNPGTCTDDIEDRPVHLVADAWLDDPLNPDPSDTTAFETVAEMTTISGLGVCDGAGNTPTPALTVTGTGALVEGFAVTKGGDAGVSTQGSVTLSNLLVYENEGELGGGIAVRSRVCAWANDLLAPTVGDSLVTATVRNSVIRNNLADDFSNFGAGDGGGLFVGGDGFEPGSGCVGGRSEVTIADNVVSANNARNLDIDFDFNDTFSAGGGISVETITDFPLLDPALSEARITVERNTITLNTVTSGLPSPAAGGFAFGGGLAGTTFGFGMETIEFESNTVGGAGVGNTATSTVAAAFGGGISGSVVPASFGLHEMTIDGNTVAGNLADFGGGIDLLVDARDMDAGQIGRLTATQNRIDANDSNLDGGGINAQLNSTRSIDEDQAPDFTTMQPIAKDVALVIAGNTISNNLSNGGGAGAILQSNANADPDNLGPNSCIPAFIGSAAAELEFINNLVENNQADNTFPVAGCSDNVCEDVICFDDPFCCAVTWDSQCATSASLEISCDCGASDCCGSVSAGTAVGAVLARMVAKGDARSTVSIETATIAVNRTESSADGFNAGIDAVSVTIPDCELTDVGQAFLHVDRTIVSDNEAFGIGGPAPAENDLTPTVIKSFVYDNGPGNGTSLQYEPTLFPGGAPAGNPDDDPLLDPISLIPDLCSPAFTVGFCSVSTDTVCTNDSDCLPPAPADGGGGVVTGVESCVAEGAGYIASPDINRDEALDGVDLVRFSAAFGAADGVDPRYNPDADLDRDGMVDGTDLPIIAPLFGQQCVPAP
jgi:hypothetical protein